MKEQLIEKLMKCIEKAADDFTEGKTVDCVSLTAIVEGIRGLHHLENMKKERL